MAFKKTTKGTAPYFNFSSSVASEDGKSANYTDHGVGWAFESKHSSGISVKLKTWPMNDEVVAYGTKGGKQELYQSPGNSPDYVLQHASSGDDGKTSYSEVGVGWSFDKRTKAKPDAPHGVSFKLSAHAFDGNLVAFEFEERQKD